MSWTYTAMMAVLDIVFVVAAIFAFVQMRSRAHAVTLVGARREILHMSIGAAATALFYGAHLAFLLILPFFAPMETVRETMEFWLMGAGWGFVLLIILVTSIGFTGILRKFSAGVESLQSQNDALREAVDQRNAADADFKSAALEARASNQAKSEFLAGMSHEFRTPLNGILGLAGLLQNTDLDEEQRKLLGTLEESAQVLSKKVNEVLDLSRLETGRVEMQTKSFKPQDLLRSVEALFAPLAAEKGLDFSTSWDDSAARAVIGDPNRIKQILNNLVSNAIKFTPTGSVRFEARTEPAGPGRLWLVLSVIDTGVGMESASVEALSTPPSHLVSGGGGGTGLGLSICWRLVRMMDGEISVRSRPDKGSTFTARVQVAPDRSMEDADFGRIPPTL